MNIHISHTPPRALLNGGQNWNNTIQKNTSRVAHPYNLYSVQIVTARAYSCVRIVYRCAPSRIVGLNSSWHWHRQSCQPVLTKKSIPGSQKTYFQIKKSIFPGTCETKRITTRNDRIAMRNDSIFSPKYSVHTNTIFTSSFHQHLHSAHRSIMHITCTYRV